VRKAGAPEIRPDQENGQEDELVEGDFMMSWREHRTRSLRPLCVLALITVLFAVLAGATRAAAAEPLPTETYAHWSLESRVAPESLVPGTEGMIIATATDIGDAEVNAGAGGSTVTISDTLPAGVTAISVEASSNNIGEERDEAKLKIERKEDFTCPTLPAPGKPIECTFKQGTLVPYELLQLKIRVKVNSGAQPGENKISVTGGNAPPAQLVRTVKIGSAPATFGVESFEMTPENEKFERDEQAGSHPFQLTTTFNLNQGFELSELEVPPSLLPTAPALDKSLSFRLPPGLIGDVNAVKQCTGVEFGSQGEAKNNACPNETAVGAATVTVFDPSAHGEFYATYLAPVFNLEPGAGEPARFGFSVLHVPVVLDTSLRTGEDYGVTVSVHYASQNVQVVGSKVTFWGIPGDERHNNSRGWVCLHDAALKEPQEPCGTPAKPSGPLEPLLMLPTKCGKLETSVEGEAWNGAPLVGANEKGEQADRVPSEAPTELKGCGGLEFNPSLNVQPETHEASTPTGLNFTLTMPQTGTMEASYKNTPEAAIESTKVELPVGLQTGAGAANGLTACPAASLGFNEPGNGKFQAGLGEAAQTGNNDFSATLPAPTEALPEPPCLSTSKIGTVTIKTPVLERELTGGVYLSQQDTDPFASPLVIYIIATDKAPGEEDTSKVVVKLAGEVTINPSNGQLVSYFRNTPQSPVETLTLHLWNGNRASQVTPARCGTYDTKSLYTTSSQGVAPTEPEYPFQITSGPEGTPCPGATLPFQPGFQAESSNPNAGGYTPFRLGITVPDGDAALKTIGMQLPPGLAAVLASVPLCPEPQAAEGTCGAESEIGQSVALSGLGGTPVRLPGKVYLTGPYNGAPFGLSSVTEAHAGPFELGRVVVRSGITVNPYTAAATITTENARFVPGELNASNEFTPVAPLEGEQTEFAGLPERLKGVPSQLKELEVTVNRPGFEFNPTSCEKMSVDGTLTGYEGTSAGVSSPFQVANCGALPFAPKLTATVSGQGSKPNGVTFAVKVESAGIGQANIHKVDLTLPEVLPSRQSTIEKACLEAVFNANPANCDEGSLIGEGIVHTPVFKNPLRGPAYLVSHGAAAFPDVEFVLQGEGVTVILDGKTDIKKGITYSKFETSPDAPFTSFESIFPAGPHSALTTYVPEKEDFNLCNSASKLVIPTELTGQNGAFISQNTKIALIGCGAVKGSTVKKLTRAQLLAKALKACRTKYKKKKSKRIACEKQARKKYGPTHKKKPAKKSAHKSASKSSAAKR
jgi:hypothetical protein